ncbi:MAG TPA: ATP-binding protein [Candidatus Brocadiia bacterium]|nr:ATP-binding protein [Candidatus Brocadiia bacterium]
MIPKTFEQIDKTDIESLMTNQVREGLMLEYKRDPLGNSDDDKRKFLAAVSSFANSAGGDLLYGVEAKDGVPIAIPGLPVDVDKEMLRLEEIVRSGIAPRLVATKMRPIDGFVQGSVLLIRISRSWAAPHMVVFGNLSRFYTRNSAGKHQMDVTELRTAFALSDALPEKMKRFRDDRLAKIIAAETPVRLPDGPKFVLHLLPLASFSHGLSLDVRKMATQTQALRPIASGGWNHRVNVDGVVCHDGSEYGTSPDRGYCQLFRSGQIEAVWADGVIQQEGHLRIPSVAYERDLTRAVKDYLQVLRTLEIPLPVLVMLTMTGVNGVIMFVNPRLMVAGHPIDRDVLIIPDVLIEEWTVDLPRVLRSVFDVVWNACGYQRSFNYDTDGNWNPQQ